MGGVERAEGCERTAARGAARVGASGSGRCEREHVDGGLLRDGGRGVAGLGDQVRQLGRGADVIELAPGCTYTLTAVDNYWYGPNGLPPIASEITIEGNGATIARSATAPLPVVLRRC